MKRKMASQTKSSPKRFAEKVSQEKLSFMGGTSLGNVDIFIESGDNRRKVRRILEKRVCQDIHSRWTRSDTNCHRYVERSRVSRQMKNIYGGVPEEELYLRRVA